MQVKAGREDRRKNDAASKNFLYKKYCASAMFLQAMQ